MKIWNVHKIRESKGKEKLACLTAYDYPTARLLDAVGMQIVLVGDSLGTTVLGYGDTVPVTMKQMLHHTAAVSRGVRDALVVADMPFLSFSSTSVALRNAGLFLQQANADAVKIECDTHRVATVRELVANGIPVLGHIGLLPQSIRAQGKYGRQGKTDEAARQLLDNALALEEAGVFAIVLECMPHELARKITSSLAVPTIGIGAGPYCDGQILVVQDMLGLSGDKAPGFARKFADLEKIMSQAFVDYVEAVKKGGFPPG